MFERLRTYDRWLGALCVFLLRLSGPRRCNRKEGRIKKVLCVKLWGLGNLAVIYPLLHRIKERFQDAELLFLTFDINKDFLEGCPAVDRVICFKLTRNVFSIARQCLQLLKELKKEELDLVVNFETRNNLSALFCHLLRPSFSAGLDNGRERSFYDRWVFNEPTAHISEVFCSLLGTLDIKGDYCYFPFAGRPADRDKVAQLLKGRGIERFVCIHPGSSVNFSGKRYGKERFAGLADLILESGSHPVIFTGGPAEKGIVADILEELKSREKVLDLCGRLTIWEFVELLKKSSVFISSDTGPLHVAASLGVNVAAFYGPTSPCRYGPLNRNSVVFYKGLECSPCEGARHARTTCKGRFSCLDISPREVFSKISEAFLNA